MARSFGAAGPVNRRHLGALLRPAIGANSLRLGTKINTATFLTGIFCSGSLTVATAVLGLPSAAQEDLLESSYGSRHGPCQVFSQIQ